MTTITGRQGAAEGDRASLSKWPLMADSVAKVGGIGGEPLRLEAEALFGALQHGSCGAHFGLADRARGFNIHDHATLDVDQIVVGISEERRPFEGAGSAPHRAGSAVAGLA